MAELPKYQQTGRFAPDMPQLDFANVRESFRASQMMTSGLDKLSAFAFNKAGEQAIKNAEEYSINNPPTPEQLDLAASGTLTEKDFETTGGAIFQNTYQKLQAEQLRSMLDIRTQDVYLNLLNEVKAKNITSDSQLVEKLEAPIAGMSKSLANLNPESAIRYKASSAALAYQVRKTAGVQFEQNIREDNDVLANKALETSVSLLSSISGDVGLDNVDTQLKQINLIRTQLEKSANNGTQKNATKLLTEFDAEVKALTVKVIEDNSDNLTREVSSGNPDAELLLGDFLQKFTPYGKGLGLDPTAVEKTKQAVIEKFNEARIEAEYEMSRNKSAYVAALEEDFKKGPVGNLFNAEGQPIKTNRVTRGVGLNKAETLINSFKSDIKRKNSEYRELKQELLREVDSMQQIITLGQTPSQKSIDNLTNKAFNLGVSPADSIAQKIAAISTTKSSVEFFKTLNIVQLESLANNLNSKLKDGATLPEAQQANLLDKYRTNLKSDNKTDPVSRMLQNQKDEDKVNIFEPFNPDVTDEEKLKLTSKRARQSTIYAKENLLNVKLFTVEESNVLSDQFNNSDSVGKQSIINTITKFFPNNAEKALDQIANKNPELAYLGGLSIGGQTSLVSDALKGAEIKSLPQFKNMIQGNPADLRAVTVSVLGNLPSLLPEPASAAIEIATNAAIQRSVSKGSDVIDPAILSKTLQEAFGQTINADGKSYGGIISYKNMRLPIPNNIEQDNFENVLSDATQKDFQSVANGTLTDSKGRKYSAESLSNAYLAPISEDTFAVYVNNYTNTDETPIRFMTKEGEPLILNIRELANIVQGRPNVKSMWRK